MKRNKGYISIFFHYLGVQFTFKSGDLRKTAIEIVKQTILGIKVFPEKDTTFCEGDSGGGTQIIQFSNINLLLAIHSGSVRPKGSNYCGHEGYQVNITEHSSWIESIAFADL